MRREPPCRDIKCHAMPFPAAPSMALSQVLYSALSTEYTIQYSAMHVFMFLVPCSEGGREGLAVMTTLGIQIQINVCIVRAMAHHGTPRHTMSDRAGHCWPLDWSHQSNRIWSHSRLALPYPHHTRAGDRLDTSLSWSPHLHSLDRRRRPESCVCCVVVWPSGRLAVLVLSTSTATATYSHTHTRPSPLCSSSPLHSTRLGPPLRRPSQRLAGFWLGSGRSGLVLFLRPQHPQAHTGTH